jgi:hypothetical protein
MCIWVIITTIDDLRAALLTDEYFVYLPIVFLSYPLTLLKGRPYDVAVPCRAPPVCVGNGQSLQDRLQSERLLFAI